MRKKQDRIFHWGVLSAGQTKRKRTEEPPGEEEMEGFECESWGQRDCQKAKDLQHFWEFAKAKEKEIKRKIHKGIKVYLQ